MTIELTILLSIAGVVIAYLGYQANKQRNEASYQKNIKNEATRDAVIETKLDSINNGVENIRIDLKANEQQIGALGERVTRVEESSKQAHRRIDNLEGGD